MVASLAVPVAVGHAEVWLPSPVTSRVRVLEGTVGQETTIYAAGQFNGAAAGVLGVQASEGAVVAVVGSGSYRLRLASE